MTLYNPPIVGVKYVWKLNTVTSKDDNDDNDGDNDEDDGDDDESFIYKPPQNQQ